MKAGKLLITAGGCMILLAFALTGYNLWDNARAGREAEQALEKVSQIMEAIPNMHEKKQPVSPVQPEKTETASESYETVDPDAPSIPPAPETESVYPDYELDPDMEMPVVTVDGTDYIGVLEIPSIAVRLPIIESWNKKNLKISPCRFVGSVYKSDFVIAGHNYVRHFGSLKELKFGDRVLFTDMDGNIFVYEVIEVLTLGPYENTNMKTGDWDMTVFTCTLGGKTRVTVRCALTEKVPNL